MGINTQIELEKMLYDEILEKRNQNKRYLCPDFLCHQKFELDHDGRLDFLEKLEARGFIALDGYGARMAIGFGPHADEWRKFLESHFSQGENPPIANQVINITNSQHVNAAGHAVNISLTGPDAENLVRILSALAMQAPGRGGLPAKIKSILDCGASAVDILKKIAALDI